MRKNNTESASDIGFGRCMPGKTGRKMIFCSNNSTFLYD
ncbi:hypothetical protein HNP36_002709 [Chryseobacterium shigense]|uniref:Uncharacterized protein n=1 Tax=Chryseobacterium shigense TaxID=297244 RepID=A0A841N409_9FLAO|nr:hypothetical protein [Chryseobacterium shigense]